MPLSSLLKTIKINGGVEFRRARETRDSRRIFGRSVLRSGVSISSRLITIWTTGLAYRTWADDDDDDPAYRRNERCQLMNGTVTHEWTTVWDASHRSYVEVEMEKNSSLLGFGSVRVLTSVRVRFGSSSSRLQKIWVQVGFGYSQFWVRFGSIIWVRVFDGFKFNCTSVITKSFNAILLTNVKS